MIKKVLTIAGSDSSGGAGIQADIKTITCHKMYAMSAITALTAQNTTGVYGVQEATPEFVGQQIDCIFNDIRPDAVKIGMVSSSKIIKVIVEKLKQYNAESIVVDPVMVATSGSPLLEKEAMSTLINELLPMGTVITPNIPEAEILCGFKINEQDDMLRAAKEVWYKQEKIYNENTHGTGCTLSSAIACNLADGYSIEDSIRNAKTYITGALKAGLNLGKGSGPLEHNYNIKIK